MGQLLSHLDGPPQCPTSRVFWVFPDLGTVKMRGRWVLQGGEAEAGSRALEIPEHLRAGRPPRPDFGF